MQQERGGLSQAKSPEQRLAQEVQRLRSVAAALSIRRAWLLRRASQYEAQLRHPGPHPPKQQREPT